MGGAVSLFEATNWEKAHGKLCFKSDSAANGVVPDNYADDLNVLYNKYYYNYNKTIDGCLPTTKYGVYYLIKKGAFNLNQREYDIIDEENNLLYTTKSVQGTIACFDLLDGITSNPILRVTVDISRRYWYVHRFHNPVYEGQIPDKVATDEQLKDNSKYQLELLNYQFYQENMKLQKRERTLFQKQQQQQEEETNHSNEQIETQITNDSAETTAADPMNSIEVESDDEEEEENEYDTVAEYSRTKTGLKNTVIKVTGKQNNIENQEKDDGSVKDEMKMNEQPKEVEDTSGTAVPVVMENYEDYIPRPKIPGLYKVCCVTVSWSRYMAVSTMYGPPNEKQIDQYIQKRLVMQLQQQQQQQQQLQEQQQQSTEIVHADGTTSMTTNSLHQQQQSTLSTAGSPKTKKNVILNSSKLQNLMKYNPLRKSRSIDKNDKVQNSKGENGGNDLDLEYNNNDVGNYAALNTLDQIDTEDEEDEKLFNTALQISSRLRLNSMKSLADSDDDDDDHHDHHDHDDDNNKNNNNNHNKDGKKNNKNKNKNFEKESQQYNNGGGIKESDDHHSTMDPNWKPKYDQDYHRSTIEVSIDAFEKIKDDPTTTTTSSNISTPNDSNVNNTSSVLNNANDVINENLADDNDTDMVHVEVPKCLNNDETEVAVNHDKNESNKMIADTSQNNIVSMSITESRTADIFTNAENIPTIESTTSSNSEITAACNVTNDENDNTTKIVNSVSEERKVDGGVVINEMKVESTSEPSTSSCIDSDKEETEEGRKIKKTASLDDSEITTNQEANAITTDSNHNNSSGELLVPFKYDDYGNIITPPSPKKSDLLVKSVKAASLWIRNTTIKTIQGDSSINNNGSGINTTKGNTVSDNGSETNTESSTTDRGCDETSVNNSNHVEGKSSLASKQVALKAIKAKYVSTLNAGAASIESTSAKISSTLNSTYASMNQTIDDDPFEGVIDLDTKPIILCQEIYNKIIGNWQSSLISKEKVLELLRSDMLQHMQDEESRKSGLSPVGPNVEVQERTNSMMLSLEQEILAAESSSSQEVKIETSLTEPITTTRVDKESSDTTTVDNNNLTSTVIVSVEEKQNASPSDLGNKDEEKLEKDHEEEEEEQQIKEPDEPLIGYWKWENTIRTHKMKMHVAAGTDLALHVVMAILVNQVRYERNAIALTV